MKDRNFGIACFCAAVLMFPSSFLCAEITYSFVKDINFSFGVTAAILTGSIVFGGTLPWATILWLDSISNHS